MTRISFFRTRLALGLRKTGLVGPRLESLLTTALVE